MKCIAMVLMVLACSTALGEDFPIADLYVGAKDGEVRLLWIPRTWEPSFDGFVVRRRAEGGKWQQLSKVIEPSADDRSYFLSRDLLGLRRHLLENPHYAHERGFAYIDGKDPKKTAARSYEYAIYLVENGRTKATPAGTVTWDSEYAVDLDIGLQSADTLWNEKGVAAFAKVDARKLDTQAVGFRVIERRGEKSRDLYGLIRPNSDLLDWQYLCHEAKAPFPDAISFAVEDNFGFQVSVTSKIDERAPRTQRDAVPSRKCWEPVMVSVSPGGKPLPPVPPPMHWVGPLATR